MSRVSYDTSFYNEISNQREKIYFLVFQGIRGQILLEVKVLLAQTYTKKPYFSKKLSFTPGIHGVLKLRSTCYYCKL